MASVKIFSLVVRTLAKPIANTVKAQATEHESFRNLCIGIAQRMHRTEARMRLGLLNEEAKNVKPLNDTRAVQNGATFLAESFLFAVAAGLVLGETYRSSRKESKRRDDVRERIEALEEEVKRSREALEGKEWQAELGELRDRNQSLENVLSTVVSNGLKAGWLALGHNELEAESMGGSGSASSSSFGAAGGGAGAGSILPLIDQSKAFQQRRAEAGRDNSDPSLAAIPSSPAVSRAMGEAASVEVTAGTGATGAAGADAERGTEA